MTDAEMENLVRRSYQYVALYNTLLNFAVNKKNPFASGGWNKTHYPEGLMDASVRAIPRPNNDTLYVLSLMDLRQDPVVIHYPAFDSKFVSLETSAMDHYVEIPLATSKGDFKKPTTILYYSARTEGYKGEAVRGVDKIMEMSGDFAIAFLRVMPEAADPAKFKANMAALHKVKLQTLSEFQGKPRKPADKIVLPPYGTASDTFAHHFLPVMQFVFNHTTFDPGNDMDQKALAALRPLGVKPGRTYHASRHDEIDGEQLAQVAGEVAREQLAIWNDPKKAAGEVAREQLAIWNDPKKAAPLLTRLFQPKGHMDIDAMVLQSAVGPLGQPADQAMYPGIATADGKPTNAQHDYVIRMTKDELPPAIAFWSLTLYDAKHGFFIPNKQKKYSVGQNAGMKLNASGGIEVYIAAEQPKGVPAENWLPITREDLDLDVIMRVCGAGIEIEPVARVRARASARHAGRYLGPAGGQHEIVFQGHAGSRRRLPGYRLCVEAVCVQAWLHYGEQQRALRGRFSEHQTGAGDSGCARRL
jgi:hypothetical protein